MLYSFRDESAPLSDFIRFGTPYTVMYSLGIVFTVSWFVFLHPFATGQRLFLSTAFSIKGVDGKFLSGKFLVTSSWIS